MTSRGLRDDLDEDGGGNGVEEWRNRIRRTSEGCPYWWWTLPLSVSPDHPFLVHYRLISETETGLHTNIPRLNSSFLRPYTSPCPRPRIDRPNPGLVFRSSLQSGKGGRRKTVVRVVRKVSWLVTSHLLLTCEVPWADGTFLFPPPPTLPPS